MGRRGPLPKQYPDNVTRIRSDVTHSTPKTGKRKPRVRRPLKPPWLDDYGGRVWDRVIKELEPLGLLSTVDREILAAYCDTASFAKEARSRLMRQGVIIVGQKGEDVKNPAWQIFREASGKISELGSKLALNPSARLRILAELDLLDDEDDTDLD